MNAEVQIIYRFDEEEIGRATLHLYDHEIVDVVVKEEARRQGLATALVTALEAYAKCAGLPRVFATVRVDNKPSIALWEKLNYGGGLLKFEKWIKK